MRDESPDELELICYMACIYEYLLFLDLQNFTMS
jgi:hypothetical protein